MTKPDDLIPDGPLTEAEVRRLRLIMRADERAQWAIAFTRRLVLYTSGVLVALWAGWDALGKLLGRGTGAGP